MKNKKETKIEEIYFDRGSVGYCEVREEPKQQTLEEVEKLAIQKRNELGLKGTIDGFIAGYQQAEKHLYSFEELKKARDKARNGQSWKDFINEFKK